MNALIVPPPDPINPGPDPMPRVALPGTSRSFASCDVLREKLLLLDLCLQSLKGPLNNSASYRLFSLWIEISVAHGHTYSRRWYDPI